LVFLLKKSIRWYFIPHLFNLRIDDLSLRLKSHYTSRKIASMIINHLCYADELVLTCPSDRGLHELLKTCVKYVLEHDIKFNIKKNVVLVRKSKLLLEMSQNLNLN